jgi:hypothetical protein
VVADLEALGQHDEALAQADAALALAVVAGERTRALRLAVEQRERFGRGDEPAGSARRDRVRQVLGG